MELIHADVARRELGFVRDMAGFDAEISLLPDAKEAGNSWRLMMGVDTWERRPIEPGGYIYINDAEWGGPVEKISHNTAGGIITLSGLCWRGMMARKVITPPPGKAYLAFEGATITRMLRQVVLPQLGELFTVENSGLIISASYRYEEMLRGLQRALDSVGCVLDCRYDSAAQLVRLSARPVVDYADTLDLSQDYGIDLVSSNGSLTGYNHIIALGRGELTERTVIDLYRLDDGTITAARPAWAGTLKDRVSTYDYSSAESTEELVKGATQRLQEQGHVTSLELDASGLDIPAQLGDIVGARDRVTGMTGKAPITGMILKMDSAGIKIEKRVG